MPNWDGSKEARLEISLFYTVRDPRLDARKMKQHKALATLPDRMCDLDTFEADETTFLVGGLHDPAGSRLQFTVWVRWVGGLKRESARCLGPETQCVSIPFHRVCNYLGLIHCGKLFVLALVTVADRIAHALQFGVDALLELTSLTSM